MDDLLDEALRAGPPDAMEQVTTLAALLSQAGVRWALDGRSAVAVQGLPLPHADLAVALLDDDVSRLWLRTPWTKGLDRHGFPLAPSRYESPEDVRICTREPVHCRLGFVHARFVEELPATVLPLLVDGQAVPVLPLAELRRAHAALAELLDRHEERTAGRVGRRTV